MRLPDGLIWLILAALPVRAADPQSQASYFDNGPARIAYFEDSTSVLYHDAISRNVYLSSSEGKEWSPVQGVPRNEAIAVVEHPYDLTMAFILTKGTTHYRTINRGQTWQSFTTPLPPSSAGVSALSFHATELGWIIYSGQWCEASGGPWQGKTCYDDAFVTRDAFATEPKKLMDHTSKCIWAHGNEGFSPSAPKEALFCVAFEASPATSAEPPTDGSFAAWMAGIRSLRESRLYTSDDFFSSPPRLVDLGIGKEARGIVGLGAMRGYLVVALKPTSDDFPSGTSDEMVLYVSKDAQTWHRGIFPHGHGLKENAYTIVDSTPYSILVDVLTDPVSNSGTLFTSNSDGTYFVRSLEHTNRNTNGIVDFEKLENVEGVAVANILSNWQDFSYPNQGIARRIQTRITYDDGSHWQPIRAPSTTTDGSPVRCDTSDLQHCALHFHSVTSPHNYGRIFSSKAPGLVMGVGSIGEYLLDYDSCDTFVSADAGLTWRMVARNANMYEFGDQGAVLVMADDEKPSSTVQYSFDYGATWQNLDMGIEVRAKGLTTIPDSTSLKFLLVGQASTRNDKDQRALTVFLDFATVGKRVCRDDDFEKWYARRTGPDGEADCLMGHKDWFRRRKQDADCVVAEKFKDPVGREENCACTDEDYECDYNYVRDAEGKECILSGPQIIPPGSCQKPGDTFVGSSGYRKIPGNTCEARGAAKDSPKRKDCSEGEVAPGQVSHQQFEFPALVLDHVYFKQSHTILTHLSDNSVWQSHNEGFTWNQVQPGQQFLSISMHPHDNTRAFLSTEGRTVYYTNNQGMDWRKFDAPTDANVFGVDPLKFHPESPDWLIWHGSVDCSSSSGNQDSNKPCHMVVHYSKNGGSNWHHVEDYAQSCSWGRDVRFPVDSSIIVCHAYKEHSGNQHAGLDLSNPLQLIIGRNFYSKKTVAFAQGVVGYAVIEEYMVVAVMSPTGSLSLMVSLNAQNFAQARFPPNMRLENSAYTILESVTDSLFLHVTTNPRPQSAWGNLFKSNSNGTNFAFSLEYANRNDRGYVDFEKMIGLEGIALMNVVSNPTEAAITGAKKLQTRITYNDGQFYDGSNQFLMLFAGGRWKPLPPPAKDSLGNPYTCSSTACGLHLHGYTERIDPRATYSSPTAVGLMIGVGNVGMTLAPYADSDTFLTRDGGFTWEEIHKDAHLWEFGDQGSILILANDEQPTDHVIYSTNEGLSWQEYNFGTSIKIRSIVTVPSDTSRKFILFGYETRSQDHTIAIHLDLSKLTNRKCVLDLSNPNNDDFTLWSPAEQREEKCLFGKTSTYHRRIRDRNCYIGELLPPSAKQDTICECTADDFECEFNHVRDETTGNCVLVSGAVALESDSYCTWGQDKWYERTAYRKVPHSACQGGLRLDRGVAHRCTKRHGFLWWVMVIIVTFLFAGLFAFWYARRRGAAKRGRIRLGGERQESLDSQEGGLGRLAEHLSSIPWFLFGVIGQARAWVSGRIPQSRTRGGYRTLPLDDDAPLLDEDEH